ncbi:MAG: hypothetical protein HQL68_11730 [Magnetococcales bacterium]|nr:hypothetical protein [Magnetococcales bacterium]
MLIKSLLVTEAVLLKAIAIKEKIGDNSQQFLDHMHELNSILAQEPSPDFTKPLVAALHLAFSSPAEPIVGEILQNNGFDYRFITGKPKSFSALKPGREVPPQIQRLWQQAREAGQKISQ